MTQRNGLTQRETCLRLAFAGERTIRVSFYHDARTRAIGFERNDSVFINMARTHAGAGSPSNIAHEFSHTMGFRHRFNWSLLSHRTVPYAVGKLVTQLSANSALESAHSTGSQP